MLLVDQSGSTRFGEPVTKAALAVEVAAVLALAAAYHNDRVGALLFADQVERVIPPRKGRRHALRVIRDLVAFEPVGPAHQPRRPAFPTPAACSAITASSSCSPISSPRAGSARCAGSPRGTRWWRSRWTTRASTSCPTPAGSRCWTPSRGGGCWWIPAAGRCGPESPTLAARRREERSRTLASVGRRRGAARDRSRLRAPAAPRVRPAGAADPSGMMRPAAACSGPRRRWVTRSGSSARVDRPPGRTPAPGGLGGRRSRRAARARRASLCGAGRPRSPIPSRSGGPGATRCRSPGRSCSRADGRVDSLPAEAVTLQRRQRPAAARHRHHAAAAAARRLRAPSGDDADAAARPPGRRGRSCSRRCTGGGGGGASRSSSRCGPRGRRTGRARPSSAGPMPVNPAPSRPRPPPGSAPRSPQRLPRRAPCAGHRDGARPCRRAAARLAACRAGGRAAPAG